MWGCASCLSNGKSFLLYKRQSSKQEQSSWSLYIMDLRDILLSRWDLITAWVLSEGPYGPFTAWLSPLRAHWEWAAAWQFVQGTSWINWDKEIRALILWYFPPRAVTQASAEWMWIDAAWPRLWFSTTLGSFQKGENGCRSSRQSLTLIPALHFLCACVFLQLFDCF